MENKKIYKSFNYIGSKLKLLDFLKNSIEKFITKKINEINGFADLFSGTGIVSYYMLKNGCKNVISNDIQYYAYIISSIHTKKNISKDKMFKIIDNLNNNTSVTKTTFITDNYTPNENCERMYLTKENGLKIDRIRQEIEKLLISNEITQEEYLFLLKVLLYCY